LKMLEIGARDVFVVEPDETKALQAAEKIGRDKVLICKVSEMDKRYDGMFDLATCFKFSMPYDDRDPTLQRLTQLLKPEGRLILTAYDYQYREGAAAIMPNINKYFQSTNADPTYFGTNGAIFVGRNPINQEFLQNLVQQQFQKS
jgi:hypothetical protein